MSKKELASLSPLEWKIMRIVCDLKSCAARDVYNITQEKYDMHPGTTRTLLRRLTEKGHLKTKQIGNCFVYEPQVSLIDSVMNEAEILFDHALGGNAGPLVLHMVKQGKLTEKDLNELRSLITDSKKQTRK